MKNRLNNLPVKSPAELRILARLKKRADLLLLAEKNRPNPEFDRSVAAYNKDVTASEAVDAWNGVNEMLAQFPARYENSLIKEFTNRAKKDINSAEGWIYRLFSKMKRHNMPFAAIGSDSAASSWADAYCKNAAKTSFKSTFTEYKYLTAKAKHVGFDYPTQGKKTLTPDEIKEAIEILKNQQWWIRKARVSAAQVREYIAIYRGLVSSNAKKYKRYDKWGEKHSLAAGDTYISFEGLESFRERQKKGEEFLQKNYIAEEGDEGFIHGTELCLADASASTVANPEIRRLELMARLRGTEEAAKAAGFEAIFVTWTAPAKYHAISKKWNGSDPRETQQYLTKQWAKARAEIKDAWIQVCGVRVVEPHNDETPHWHLLLFVKPEQKSALISILQRYACQHEKEELAGKNGIKPRFVVEHIDPSKGSAVGYIAKYISKSINGAKNEHETALDIDLDTGERIDTGEAVPDVAEKVRAWASTWKIRQFQFVGLPPVTLWRELRRERDGIQSETAAMSRADLIHHAANRGNFAAYIKLNNGLCATRASGGVELLKQEYKNQYGFIKQRIAGFMAGELVQHTRKAWLRVGKLGLKDVLNAFQSFLQDGSRAAWTRVNNCKYTPEQINEKLLSVRAVGAAFVGFYDRLGNWITEKITNYYEIEEQITC